MNALRYDAMTIGVLDCARGLDMLLARSREAKFPMLACNLVSNKDQKPVLAPYTVLERGGMRLGIIGVTEPDTINAPTLREVAQVLDPVATVKQYLAEVRGKSDVVMLLSHLGLEEDKALAQQVPGIDIMVGGKTRKCSRSRSEPVGP
jgi:5'-nucleotidase / UDP-sugar diphosphatase